MPSKKKAAAAGAADDFVQNAFDAGDGSAQDLAGDAASDPQADTAADAADDLQEFAEDPDQNENTETPLMLGDASESGTRTDHGVPDSPIDEEVRHPVAKATVKRRPRAKRGPDDEQPDLDLPMESLNLPPDMPAAEDDGEPSPGEEDDAETARTDGSADEDDRPPGGGKAPPRKRAPRRKTANLDVLKLAVGSDVETPEDRDDIIWHEIHNAYRTRRILSGILGGVERLENGKTIAVVDYKGFRIVISMDEMMIDLPDGGSRFKEAPNVRRSKHLSAMVHAEVDFIIRGIDSKTRSVVASRRDAMMKKRQTFYFSPDMEGKYRIYEGRVVQARVVAVAERLIRVEAFGAECNIRAVDLSWEWMGDVRDHYSVGDNILVRVNQIRRESPEDLSVTADARSIRSPNGNENLKKCRVQGKYAGRVTAVSRGVVSIRLSIGVNAIAHSCFDNRMPGKKDDVTFVVTHIDEEKGAAMGIITRIIRQNL